MKFEAIKSAMSRRTKFNGEKNRNKNKSRSKKSGHNAARTIDPEIDSAIDFIRAGQLPQAEALCEKILARNPLDADAKDLLGVIAYQLGNLKLSLELITNAIAINGEIADFHSHLGITLKALGRLDDALQSYEKARDLEPRSVEPVYNMAILLRQKGDLKAALELNQQAVKLDPGNSQASNNLGVNYQELGQFEEASKAYKRAIRLDPNHASAHGNLATSLAESDQVDEALTICRKAGEKWPQNVDILNAKANALMRLNRLEEALEAAEKTLAANPDYTQAHYGKAMILLAMGKFVEGWPEYEWRTRRAGFWPKRQYSQPVWQGENLIGKTLLVHWEQGFGDIIQFARFFDPLAEAIRTDEKHKNARVIFDCPGKLIALFEGAFGFDEIGDFGDQPPSFDYYSPLISLGQYLNITADNIPNRSPYLTNPLDIYLQIPSSPNLKVGLAWASDHGDTYRRKVCRADDLARLFDIPACRFYGLQFGPEGDELIPFEKDGKVVNLGNELGDFAHTAAIVSQMDLIISIDTYLVHLAGAMNVPAWVMLPFSPDWRWQLDRSDSPWYPGLRLFRQPAPGDWDGIIGQIRQALSDEAQSISKQDPKDGSN